ncbi:hypothetical protein MWG07_03395 [Fusobacterium necrophorum]|uniref:Uncharacterized protein n=4 Tax=root TaxID=1 RepID=A0AAN3VXT7_9FUSO|nr:MULTISPECIES: hypothetical protein [Fusobacterium]DAD97530.1 MAG TPA: repressor protein C2 [Caudovirales sp. ctIbU14]EJU19032.1 hypothetical protein HMPREF1127_1772 [Fusobacterium necrophorum subsp. funduliforme Fnf 1007]KXA17086.1 hypothetical protein HMPREF3206_00038 [Fusobacterium equinum]KYM50478.1 hypothetical protein A2U11_01495 [Fusobacterium necrophorum subsp. funduliforme]KYM57076.1 hypothetical protein A2U07_01510 [Fusobacterium necrophorum subsp. funduliforme]
MNPELKKILVDKNITLEELSKILDIKVETLKRYFCKSGTIPYKVQKKLIEIGIIEEKDKHSKKNDKMYDVIATLFAENEKLKNEIQKLETLKSLLSDKPKKYNDILRINSFKSDFDTTTKIIPLMWKLSDEVSKIFSELEILLEINSIQENIKIKRGLYKVGDNLIAIGDKLKLYGENTKIENDIIDAEVK